MAAFTSQQAHHRAPPAQPLCAPCPLVPPWSRCSESKPTPRRRPRLGLHTREITTAALSRSETLLVCQLTPAVSPAVRLCTNARPRLEDKPRGCAQQGLHSSASAIFKLISEKTVLCAIARPSKIAGTQPTGPPLRPGKPCAVQEVTRRTRNAGPLQRRQPRRATAADMSDLAALPLEVHIPRLSLALAVWVHVFFQVIWLCCNCLSGSSALYASLSHPAVHKREIYLVCAAGA